MVFQALTDLFAAVASMAFIGGVGSTVRKVIADFRVLLLFDDL